MNSLIDEKRPDQHINGSGPAQSGKSRILSLSELTNITSMALAEREKVENPIWIHTLTELASAADHLRSLREGREDGLF